MGSIVSLVQVPHSEEGLKNSIAKALDLINFKPVSPLKSVFIKPNLCYYWKAATGYTTDPRVVAAIIDYVRERFSKNTPIRVAEADATAMRTKHVFPMLGYEKLAKEKRVDLLNLSTDSSEKKNVQVKGHDFTFDVPSSLLNCSLFINVPKMKTMRDVVMTCALKNIFGCIATPRKIQYHRWLNETIVGVNKILHPNLTIVDGTTAFGRHPVKLNLIMASQDSFSADWVASQIMGYKPSRIPYLKLAVKEKLGSPDGISTVGEKVQTFRRMFPHQSVLSLKSWTLQLKMLKLYARISGDIIPPLLEQEM